LLLIGYFEGLDAERAIAWCAADSFALREFLGLVLPEAPPDHSTISRTRRLIDLDIVRRDTGATYQEFLTQLAQASGIGTPTREDLARTDRKRRRRARMTIGPIRSIPTRKSPR
jgi:transposase